MSVFIPPTVAAVPAILARFTQLRARMVGLAALASMMLDGFMEAMIRFGDAPLAIVISAQLESELVDLNEQEALDYLYGLGVEDTGVHALIRAVYHLLGLRTFLTTGEKESRAWTIHAGDKAATAAGTIHSDFERGFIAAETISSDDLIAAGSLAKAREAGKIRLEGKDYVVRDGDVILFRFNV